MTAPVRGHSPGGKKRKGFDRGAEGRLTVDDPALDLGRRRTAFPGGVYVRVLPGMKVIQPATYEYPEEREERLRSEDRVEVEERFKVEDGRRTGPWRLHRARQAVSPATRCLASGRPCL